VLLTIGRLGDVFGRVRLYNLGFAIFTVGSGLCSIATSGIFLVLMRLVQGLGGALIWGNNAAIVTDVFPSTERGRALGINQVAGVSGSILGLIAGGVLTTFLGWRSIFWINLAPGTFATVWAYLKLKDLNPGNRGEKLDPLGNLLFGVSLTTFLVGLTLGSIQGWNSLDYDLMAVGGALLVVFVYTETHTKTPMMDLRLFRIRAFMAGASANLLTSISRSSLSLILVFYLQGVLLYNAYNAGLLLLPFSVAFVLVGPLSGALSDRFGPRYFAPTGLVLSSFALFWFATIPYNVSYLGLAIPMVIAGAGGGLFFAPNVAAIMNSVPPARRGVASGMSSTLFNVGALISLGAVFAIFGASVPLSALQAIVAGLTPPAGTLNIQQFIVAMHQAFLIMAVISLAAALPASQTGRRTKETIMYPERDSD